MTDSPVKLISIRKLDGHSKISFGCDDADDRIRREERLSFPLHTIISNNTSIDVAYHGSEFVRDWLLRFTAGKLIVRFHDIFPALMTGLNEVGRDEPETVMECLFHALNTVHEEVKGKHEKQKMRRLEDCCAKLYTKQCFLFRVANTTLRDNDRTKLDSLGPYCYLVYNYIGRQTGSSLSFRQTRVLQGSSLTVYRGDCIGLEKLAAYQQAIGRTDAYFRWLSFVSTSLDCEVALRFGSNVLYEIALERNLTSDQFTYLKRNSYIESEQEILLKPGARFQVRRIRYDDLSERHWIYLKIIPSYVSSLR